MREVVRSASKLLFRSIAAAILLTGCGAQLQPPKVSPALVESERQRQKEQVLKLFFERAEQVSRVSTLLRTKGAELCEDNVEPVLGVFWAEKKSVPEEYWDVSERVFGVGEDLRVLSIVPGLPADAAGIKPGDIVLGINGAEIVSTFKVFNRVSKVDEAREMLRRAGVKPLSLNIKRAGDAIQVEVKPEAGCSLATKVVIDDRINAYADGKNVAIFTGMLRFVKDEDELAIVLGHELAHNTLDHINRTKTPATVGWILGLILDAAAAAGGVNTGGIFSSLGARAGTAMFSRDYETEADYMGLYFAARGGYEISKASDLWRRMAAEHPGTIKDSFMSTHPSSPERAAVIQATIAELDLKLSAHSPLLPAKQESASRASSDPRSEKTESE
jgi:Zn-dependent protease with chaperone function